MRLAKVFFIFSAVLLAATCSGYDDSDILKRLDKLEDRVSALERDVTATNNEISALKTLLEAVAANDYVTSIRAIEENGQAGWEITYSKSGTVKIFLNRDSFAPKIGVKEVNGVLYWTVDGEFLLDASGKMIQASAKNGTDGTNGSNGSNGVTPQLKIEGGYWYVSYDEGKTWTKLSAATAGSSNSGVVFRSVEVVGGNVVFTLTDGTVYTIPLISVEKTAAFDENDIVASFGIISDTHIGNNYGSEAKFTSALNQLRNRAAENDSDGLDAVLVAGDLVNTANTGQISTFKGLYEEVFDPKKVPMIYTVGNHDMCSGYRWSASTVTENAVFRTVLGDDYFLTDQDQSMRTNFECRHCIVGNYHILALTPSGINPIIYDANVLTWLNAQLKAITEADPDRYVLLITHPMIYGTCYGSVLQDTYTTHGDYWSTKALTEILSGYPQVITFGGHLHFPLNDPRSIWQGDFTSMGTASTSYMAIENGAYEDMNSVTVMNDAGEYSEGLLAQFDRSGNARFTRMDFYRTTVIGKPWYINAPKGDKSHLDTYNHTALASANTAPSLSTAEVTGTKLTFAAGTDDEFVHHYVITVKKAGAVVVTKKVLADFYRSPQPSMMKKSYELSLGALAAGDYSVSIVAYDSWDAASTPLVKEFTVTPPNVSDFIGTYTLTCKLFQDGQSTVSPATVDVTFSASGDETNNINITGLFQNAVLPASLTVDNNTGLFKLGLYFDGTKAQALTTPVTQNGTSYNYVAFLPGLGTQFIGGNYNFRPCPISTTSNQVWWWGTVDGDTISFNNANKQSLTNASEACESKTSTDYYMIAITCVLSTTEQLQAGNFGPKWNKVFQANPGDNTATGMTFTKK